MKPSQLKSLLEKTIAAKAPVLITGAPGIGKSDIVAQACLDATATLIIEHPVVSDPTDFKGLPFAVKGKADFLPFGNLERIIDAKTSTVFFLDDLGQAPPAVQAACMQLLLARRINGHKVSEQVCFIAATNRRKDRAGVQGLLEPVKSRFTTIVNLEPDLEDWVEWALGHNIPTPLIAFIRFRPNLLFDFQPTADLVNTPCPRTVSNVGRLMDMGLPKELEFEAYSGAAGEGFASEFLGFMQIFRTLPNPDMIILNPEKADVPTDPATLYAVCGALSRKASDQTFDRLVRYFNRLPAEFSVLAMRDSLATCPDAVNSRSYVEWATAHKDVLL
jgi:hypothetical protein